MPLNPQEIKNRTIASYQQSRGDVNPEVSPLSTQEAFNALVQAAHETAISIFQTPDFYHAYIRATQSPASAASEDGIGKLITESRYLAYYPQVMPSPSEYKMRAKVYLYESLRYDHALDDFLYDPKRLIAELNKFIPTAWKNYWLEKPTIKYDYTGDAPEKYLALISLKDCIETLKEHTKGPFAFASNPGAAKIGYRHFSLTNNASTQTDPIQYISDNDQNPEMTNNLSL